MRRFSRPKNNRESCDRWSRNDHQMPLKIGKCRMCGEIKPLINAHIIPRTFFEVLRGTGNYTVLVEPKASKQAQFLQAGDSDPEILCAECDNKFSPLDDYGFKILGVPQPKCGFINPATGNEAGSVIECDTDKLRRFVLAVLWRASISKQWDTVSLGSHEAKILQRILDVTPLSVDEYSIIIHRLDSNALGDFKLAILPPIRGKFEGVNVYFFYLPGLRMLIKVDKRDFKATWRPYMIGAEPDWFSLLDDNLKASGELKQIGRLHEQLQKHKRGAKRSTPGF
jgi:hypothetical protein